MTTLLEHERTSVERIGKARSTLIMDHAFFGSLSLRLKLVEDKTGKKTKTAATDGRSLFYSDAYIKTLSDAQVVGLVAHEVMHPALQHHTRRKSRDPKLWNVATDYAINGPLIRAGFQLPDGIITDPRFDGQGAEAIYKVLRDEQQEQEEQDEQDEDDGEQDGSEHGGPSGGGEGEDDSEDDSEGEGEGDGSGAGDGAGDSDSGVSEVPGAVLDAPDPIDDAAEWQMATKQAAQTAAMMGQLPEELVRVTKEANRPRFDAKSLLLRFAQEQAKSDYSWKRPNTRYIQQGVYLPEISEPAMGEIVIAIDSSGSITDDIMGKFIGVVQEVVDQVKPRSVRVLVSDAQVHAVHTFERDEPITGVKLIGGGGTDFRPVFEMLKRDDEAPAAILYLTDGYGAFPEERDLVAPTLWVMTTDVQAPNGETVRLEIDA